MQRREQAVALPPDVFAVAIKRVRKDGTAWEKTYFYYQPKRGAKVKGKRIPLGTDPTDPEFWTRLRRARGDGETFGDVVRAYLEAAKAGQVPRQLEPSTLKGYTRLANKYLLTESDPESVCHVRANEIDPYLVQAVLDGLSDKPGAQINLRTLIQAVEAWAIVRRRLPRQITTGVVVRGSDGGREPWPDWAVDLALEKGSDWVKRAVFMGVNTGQRVSDLIKFQGRDLEGGGINLRIKKTQAPHWIGLDPEVLATMQSWGVGPFQPMVPGPDGKPFTSGNRLSWHWWSERKKNPHLKPIEELGLSLHGLRSTVVVRLTLRGASDGDIANLIGMHEETVRRYRRLASQRQKAEATVLRLSKNADGTNQDRGKRFAGSAKYNPAHPKTARRDK